MQESKKLAFLFLVIAFASGLFAGYKVARPNNRESRAEYIDCTAIDRISRLTREYIATRERELSDRSRGLDEREKRFRDLQGLIPLSREGLKQLEGNCRETIRLAREIKEAD